MASGWGTRSHQITSGLSKRLIPVYGTPFVYSPYAQLSPAKPAD